MKATICEVPLDEFLLFSDLWCDVRSPSEFSQGTIPGARNIPLFSDEERSLVGTLYKRAGKQEAIYAGIEIMETKAESLIDLLCQHYPTGSSIPLFCWRGGLRSGFIAKLAQALNRQAIVLQGGYKVFRRWALTVIQRPFNLKVVGGLTGCGKTSFLHQLGSNGSQIIDLESLANHRGSSYGMLGSVGTQPTNELFENNLACALAKLDPAKDVWVENESRLIGTCVIPKHFFEQMQQAPLIAIEASKEERIRRLMDEYGRYPKEQLIEATQRIGKKLGGLRLQQAISAIEEGQIALAIEIVLEYYDRTYRSAQKR